MPVTASAQAGLLVSLQASLDSLREPWPQRWPGVALVLERCWARLGIDRAGQTGRTAALLAWSHEVARQVEEDGLSQSALGQEPAYHNRLHTADVLVCMTHLLLALRQQGVPGAGVVHLEALCLATMVGHDFRHPGGSNAFPAQFESLAVQALQPLMAAAGVDAQDQARLEQAILLTDPLCVKSTHQTAQGRAFDLADPVWMTVLVQEADILASTLPATQQGLTQALSNEWAHTNPQAAEKLLQPHSRMMFLEHAALFSSPAAQALGLGEVKNAQLQALRSRLGVKLD